MINTNVFVTIETSVTKSKIILILTNLNTSVTKLNQIYRLFCYCDCHIW